jgi:hypothetical protein
MSEAKKKDSYLAGFSPEPRLEAENSQKRDFYPIL